ncbi:unnamed protein product, partial [marine sediment metagenome]
DNIELMFCQDPDHNIEWGCPADLRGPTTI